MLTGWAKANSVDLVEAYEVDENNEYDHDVHKLNRKFGLLALVTYSDLTEEKHYISFNEDNVNWQYVSLAVVPKTKDETLTVSSITVSAVYDYNANEMLFDDICLTVEPAQTYEYDEETGKLKETVDAEGNKTFAQYTGVDMNGYTAVNGEEYDYTYREVDGINTHQVEKASKTSGGVTQRYVATSSWV